MMGLSCYWVNCHVKESPLFAEITMGIGGVNIDSASSQSPLASSILPVASASQLATPEQYGQDTRLHMSASVPMFASYWKVDLLGEPIIGAKAVAIPLNLPPFAADQRGSSYSKRTQDNQDWQWGKQLVAWKRLFILATLVVQMGKSFWVPCNSSIAAFFRFPFRQDVLAEGGTAICSYN